MSKVFNYLLRKVRNVIYKREQKFIFEENKHLIPYEKIMKINPKLLFEFRNELDLDDLLNICCRENNYELAKKLIDVGVDINFMHVFNYTPLMLCCLNNSYECVKLLIKHGANVNQTNWQNKTVLYHIVPHRSRKSRKIYNLLVKHGAHE